MIKIQSKRLAQFFLRHPIHTYYTDMYQQVHRQSNGASTYDQATAQRTENWLQRPQQKQSICSAKNKISYPPNLPPPPCPSSCHSAPALTLMNFIKIFYVYKKKFTESTTSIIRRLARSQMACPAAACLLWSYSSTLQSELKNILQGDQKSRKYNNDGALCAKT